MSYRKGNMQNRFSRSSHDKQQVRLGWIDEVYRQLVDEKRRDGTPNLFSLTTIASMRINWLKVNGSGDKSVALVRTLIERLAQYSSRADFSLINNHLNQIKQAYSSLGFPVLDLEAKLTYRGLVGASSSFGRLVFEVGLSFDPILNVPYIPGSSIKGAVKAASRLKKVIPDELVRELFGNDLAGRLDFSDAYPVEGGVKGYILIPDVLTPHYSKGGEDILEEDQAMPTPVLFLSIAPATKFRFLIADRKQEADKPFLEKLLKVVAVAFSAGVGAKTALGYGTFDLVRASVVKGGRDA